MSEFFVGQRVVCVDDDLHAEWPQNAGHKCIGPLEIKSGQDYMIRSVGNFTSPINGTTVYAVRLECVVRCDGKDTPYDARRFKPLESKAIEIFRRIAQDVTDGKVVEIA